MKIENLCMGCMNEKEEGIDTCPKCGYAEGTEPESSQHLPSKTILYGHYLVGRVLGHGGFGVTYLAWDMNLNIKVAIKEYLPKDFAGRTGVGYTVSAYSKEFAEEFTYGIGKFLDEARTLARFADHPNIVAVRDFFTENGTAYFVMNYVDGITFKQYLKQNNNRIPIEAALSIMMPVMDALQAVHEEGMLHRDVSPDNIYITKNMQVKLLDFGAARSSVSEHSKSVILKPGYSPEEQYRSKGKQGPWTDVYSVAGTIYRAITGEVPQDSLDRLDEDLLKLPHELGVEINSCQEEAIMKGLAIRGRDRYQTMEAFRTAFMKEEEEHGGEKERDAREIEEEENKVKQGEEEIEKITTEKFEEIVNTDTEVREETSSNFETIEDKNENPVEKQTDKEQEILDEQEKSEIEEDIYSETVKEAFNSEQETIIPCEETELELEEKVKAFENAVVEEQIDKMEEEAQILNTELKKQEENQSISENIYSEGEADSVEQQNEMEEDKTEVQQDLEAKEDIDNNREKEYSTDEEISRKIEKKKVNKKTIFLGAVAAAAVVALVFTAAINLNKPKLYADSQKNSETIQKVDAAKTTETQTEVKPAQEQASKAAEDPSAKKAAEEAVARYEGSKAQTDKEAAIKAVDALKDETIKKALVAKIDAVTTVSAEPAKPEAASTPAVTPTVPAVKESPSAVSQPSSTPSVSEKDTYLSQGKQAYDSKNFSKAVECYTKVLSLDSNNADAYHYRGGSYEYLNQHLKAIKDLNQAIDLNCSSLADAYTQRGFAYTNLNQGEKGLQDFNKAVSLGSTDSRSYSGRAYACVALGAYEKAIPDLNRSIEMDSSDSAGYYLRALCYLNTKVYEKAKADASKYLVLGKDWRDVDFSENAYLIRGIANEETGNKAKAIEDYSKVLSINPNNQTASERLNNIKK